MRLRYFHGAWSKASSCVANRRGQSRGALRRELTKRLRTDRALRQPSRKAGQRSTASRKWSISADAGDRAVPGHREGHRAHNASALLLITAYLLACRTRTLMAALVWWPTMLSPAALVTREPSISACVLGPPTSPPPRRSAPPGAWPWSRRNCSYASAEELADGQQQAGERQHNEYHLVDMVLARR